MTRILTVLALAAAFLSPAWASNPGEPLDCSDWVFLGGVRSVEVTQNHCLY
jgi:hypothetical protein